MYLARMYVGMYCTCTLLSRARDTAYRASGPDHPCKSSSSSASSPRIMWPREEESEQLGSEAQYGLGSSPPLLQIPHLFRSLFTRSFRVVPSGSISRMACCPPRPHTKEYTLKDTFPVLLINDCHRLRKTNLRYRDVDLDPALVPNSRHTRGETKADGQSHIPSHPIPSPPKTKTWLMMTSTRLPFSKPQIRKVSFPLCC